MASHVLIADCLNRFGLIMNQMVAVTFNQVTGADKENKVIKGITELYLIITISLLEKLIIKMTQ